MAGIEEVLERMKEKQGDAAPRYGPRDVNNPRFHMARDNGPGSWLSDPQISMLAAEPEVSTKQAPMTTTSANYAPPSNSSPMQEPSKPGPNPAILGMLQHAVQQSGPRGQGISPADTQMQGPIPMLDGFSMTPEQLEENQRRTITGGFPDMLRFWGD